MGVFEVGESNGINIDSIGGRPQGQIVKLKVKSRVC